MAKLIIDRKRSAHFHLRASLIERLSQEKNRSETVSMALLEWFKALDRKSALQEILKGREAMIAANNLPCTCTGFQVQYDGCSCGKREAIHAARNKLFELIESFKTVGEDDEK